MIIETHATYSTSQEEEEERPLSAGHTGAGTVQRRLTAPDLQDRTQARCCCANGPYNKCIYFMYKILKGLASQQQHFVSYSFHIDRTSVFSVSEEDPVLPRIERYSSKSLISPILVFCINDGVFSLCCSNLPVGGERQ